MASKNYLLSAKLSFLIMSFLICVIAITVQHDIWPILQESPPTDIHYTFWSLPAIVIGLLLPTAWLLVDWSKTAMRYGLLSLVVMLLLQILTEFLVAHYFFISMVVPTSILYGSYRIIQLINLQRVLNKTEQLSSKEKLIRSLIITTNFIFWSAVWIKFTFFVFPQIIDQSF